MELTLKLADLKVGSVENKDSSLHLPIDQPSEKLDEATVE